MSMFRRRRAASNPPPRTFAPDASASLAASKAFVRAQDSNASLSNAAAAAALRTHARSPTPVGETVTKRMVRRGSASSQGSHGPQRPQLVQRRSSSASMTERSFRNSSPGRTASPPVPPVPPVPQNIASGHRRAASLDPINRGASPVRRGGRGVSLDRGAGPSVNRVQRVGSPLAQVDEEYDASRSVNFSRPMSPSIRSDSGMPNSSTSNKGWYGGPVVNQEAVQRMASTSRPRTSSGITAADLRSTQYSVQAASQRPVSVHYTTQGAQGGRLSSGSMRAKPSGTAVQSRSFLPAASQAPRPVDPKSPDAVYDPSTRTFIHKQDAMARHRELHEEPEQPAQHYVSQHLQSTPVHTGRRTPSPLRNSVQPTDVPAQRQQQPAAPRIDTTPSTQRHESRPASPPASTPRVAPVAAPPQPIEFIDVNAQPTEESQLSPQLALNQDSPYPRVATPSNNATSNTRVEQIRGSATKERQQSLSPSRSAHFAPTTTELSGVKHEPLPRSISPAKSALKSSPSVSRRSHSPNVPNTQRYSNVASSEASDTVSEDGRAAKKKKKTVRISFDHEPVVVGTSAYANDETPTGPLPPKWTPSNQKEDEFEDFMKPRPALPSFGSVRDKERNRSDDEGPVKVTETVSTPLSASLGSIGEPVETSGDLALGNVVAQDFANKQVSMNNPLPPQVTSVEGNGYVSDSSSGPDSSARKHRGSRESSQILPEHEPKPLTTPGEDKPSHVPIVHETIAEVPDISVQPATPSPYEKPEPQYQSMMDPEGSPQESATKPAHQESVASSPASVRPTTATTQEEDSSDDNSSVYSDAYEEISDLEGGFGSINAIVESPVIGRTSAMSSSHADRSFTESPTPGSKNQEPEDPITRDWNAARAHWSGLAQPRDKTRQAAAAEAPVYTENVSVESTPQSQRSTKAEQTPKVSMATQAQQVPRASPSSHVPQASTKPLKSAMKKPATPVASAEPQMRKTMRGPAPANDSSSEHQMRKSMRGGPGPGPASRAEPRMRTSMRGSSPAHTPAGLAASRYSVDAADAKPPRGTLQKKHIPAAAAPTSRPQSMPAAAPKKPVASVPTYDSDSDASASSFQRTRSRGRRNQGQYSMRSSMRSDPAPTMRAAAPVRAISPPPSQPAFRQSMRPSSPTPETVKSSRFSIRSLSPGGRFRKKKEPEPPMPVMPKSSSTFGKAKAKTPDRGSTFKSRFADSSDEEDSTPRRFQSRFNDSDSEPETYELPPGLTPVRGIPRKAGEEDGDSTDLEEEADEEPRPSSAVAPKTETNGITNGHTNGTTNGQGAALAAGSLRDSKHATLPVMEAGSKVKTRRSFFGMGKKKTSPATTDTSAAESTSLTPDIPMPPQQRNREHGAPLTPIDEDRDIGNTTEVLAASPESKRSPKLQRRSTPDWPLPSVPAINTDERPMSSDGVARRPRFGKRRSSQFSSATAPTSPVLDTNGRSVSFGKSGKKKKFQGLRRVFGIND